MFLYRFGGLPEWLRPPSDAVHLHLLEWETASCESGVGQCLGLLGNHSSKLHPQVAPEKKEMDTVRLRAYAKEILLNLLGREGQRQEAVQPMVRPFSSDEDQGPD